MASRNVLGYSHYSAFCNCSPSTLDFQFNAMMQSQIKIEFGICKKLCCNKKTKKNSKENESRIAHEHKVGDLVSIKTRRERTANFKLSKPTEGLSYHRSSSS